MCAVDKDGLVASITPSDGSANTPVLQVGVLTRRLEGHSRGPSETTHPVFSMETATAYPQPGYCCIKDNRLCLLVLLVPMYKRKRCCRFY